MPFGSRTRIKNIKTPVIVICTKYFFSQVNGTEVLTNGLDTVVDEVSQRVTELTFEEDEEDQFFMKDLPKHACS